MASIEMFRIKLVCLVHLLAIIFSGVAPQNIVPAFNKNIKTQRDVNGAIKNSAESDLLIDNKQSKRFHVIRVRNANSTNSENAAAADRSLFILIGNDLHWLDLTSQQIFSKIIARLSEKTANENETEIVDVQATKWKMYHIFVTITPSKYNVYVLRDRELVREPRSIFASPATLMPIQRLSRIGTPKSISFVELDGDIYCLLASNLPDAYRSFVRIFKWDKSSFQIIETLENNNHQIDGMAVTSAQQLIILIHRGLAEQRETSVQIYHYATEKDEESGDDGGIRSSFHGHRIQQFNTPFDLYKPYVYYSERNGELSLDVCKALITNAANITDDYDDALCRSYTWTAITGGNADFRPILEPSSIDRWLQTTTIVDKGGLSHFKMDMDVVFLRNKNEILAFIRSSENLADKSNRREVSVPCPADTVVHMSLLKSKAINSTLTSYQIICVLNEIPASAANNLNRLRIQKSELTTVKGPDNILASGRTAGNCLDDTKDWRTNPDEMQRVKFLLQTLKEQLLQRREQQIARLQELVNEINAKHTPTDNIVESRAAAHHVLLDAKSTVKTVLLNDLVGSDNGAKQSIADASARLKEIKSNIEETRRARIHKRAATEKLTADTINITNLIIPPNRKMFEGLPLIETINNTKYYYFDGTIKTEHLEFDRLLFDNSNGSLELVTLEEPPLVVTSAGKHKEIFVDKINGIPWDGFVNSVYRKSKPVPIKGNIHLSKPAAVKNLYTNEINGIKTQDFMTLTTDQIIKSNLFISKFHAGDIQANTINRISDFEQKIVILGKDNVIESPIRIGSCVVTGNLTLSEREDAKISRHIVGTKLDDLSQIYNGKVTIRGSLKVDNIVVTPPSLNQGRNIYPNIPSNQFNPQNTPNSMQNSVHNVIIDGHPFDVTTIPNEYWMKNIDQEVGGVILTNTITTPEVYASLINNHPAADFLIIDDSVAKPKMCSPANLHFLSQVTIAGSVFTDTTDPTQKSRLTHINEEAIRRFDPVPVVLNTPMTFTNRLTVDHIAMLFDLNQYLHIGGHDKSASSSDERAFQLVNKHFRKLHVKHHLLIENPLNTTTLHIENLNEHKNLKGILNSIVLDDKPFRYDGIVVFEDGFGGDNVVIGSLIDNHGYEDVRYDHRFNISKIFANILQQKNGVIKSIRVKGNVTFEKFPPVFDGKHGADLLVGTVNGVNVTHYLPLVVVKPGPHDDDPLKHQEAPLIGGAKTFRDGLQVTFKLHAPKINNRINVQHWMKNALLKDPDEHQVISGNGWSFGTIKTKNLQVAGLVNGVNIHPIHGDIVYLDTDYREPINITSNIRFIHPTGTTVSQMTSITGALRCDLSDIFASTAKIHRNIWNDVQINRHVDCKLGENVIDGGSSGLLHFFSNAVRSSIDQSFYGNVTFHLATPTVSGIVIRQANDWSGALPLTINGIVLENILTDAVTLDIDETKPLVIYGAKQFLSDNLKIDGSLNVKKYFHADIINQVNLLELNASLIRKDQDLIHIPTGHQIVFLHPPTFGNLELDAHLSINGVPIADIFIASSNATIPVPQITIVRPNDQLRATKNGHTFHVESLLNLNLVNDVLLDHFLENRIRKYPVFNAQGHPEAQLINGSLTFENLVIAGNWSTIHSINRCELADIVRTISDETQYITGHKHITGPTNPQNGVERGVIFVNSPSVLLNVNGLDFLHEYSKSIMLNENITLKALDVPNPFFVDTPNGMFIQNTINGLNLNAGETVGSAQYTSYDVNKWRTLNENLAKKLSISPKKLRYIDRSDVFHVIRNNSQSLNAADNINQLYNTWMTIDSLYTGQSGNPGTVGHFVCPVQYHIRSLSWPSRKLVVHREEPFSRIMTVSLHPNFVIHVHTEFPSSENYFFNCNFSKPAGDRPLSIIYINQRQVLAFKDDLIESINVFYMPDDLVYMLVHIHRKHIAVLRGSFHQPYDQWQIMQKIPCLNDDVDGATDDNTITNEHLFSWQGILLLVVSNSGPIHEHANQSDKISSTSSTRSTVVYRFHSRHEKFYREHEVSGDYNIINGLEMNAAHGQIEAPASQFVLILGRQQSKFLTTWVVSIQKDAIDSAADALHFELQEKLDFDVAIRAVSTFSEFDIFYLSVVLKDGHFHIFRYAGALKESVSSPWTLIMPGYFEDLQAMAPFIFNQKLYIFVLAGTANNSSSLDSYPILTLYY